MSSQPSDNALIQQLQLLLTGYGYNFYNQTNQARADDLLVRERASYFLAQAVSTLAQLRSDYHTRFVPPLTRANPDPPQEAMAQLRAIEAAQQALAKVESGIRGMAVPSQDRIWWRFRQEQSLLMRLLNFDLTLVRASEQIYQYVSRMTPEDWSQQSGALQQMTRQLAQTVTERERFLLLPL
ncbi:hypothetical protein [Dictyobacter aurantiacus]|uniref:Uncharacterized protein n=1 Tax=Dictyobacter aurantiacus TaxID=1936993 RepID=A0A401ZP71_9CHLR|nr:hypothetical protein [Dictyobacter aurantiacus]GCE08653.1 hypothetical protein KDAU_59820 [Dictyobacter aurantiacus]